MLCFFTRGLPLGSPASLLFVLVALVSWEAVHCRTLQEQGAATAFLQDKLPLRATVTTPTDILFGSSGAVALSGRQTITVVFSRPVIKLGSDFAASGFGDQVPFHLSCSVPGKYRWVTTNIARFDPDISWPTDLACTFTWNKDLTSYDGVLLETPAQLSRPLTTTTLTMTAGSVTSKSASDKTDNVWDATTGLADDKLPEVPPDGVMALQFNYQVDLALLSKGLAVQRQQPGGNFVSTDISVQASECLTPVAIPYFSKGMARGGWGAPMSTQGPSQDNTCAQIKISRGSLDADTWYQACLPSGATYNNVSGSLPSDLCVRFGGLRRFRFPFNTQQQDGSFRWDAPSFRRLDLWLVHGLADGVTAEQLQKALSLCRVDGKACIAEEFTASLKNKGTLRLSVPGLAPGATYRISVAASAGVRDGFDLPLTEGSGEFRMAEVPAQLAGPSVSSRVATVEPLGTLAWPFITHPGQSLLNTASFFTAAGDDRQILDVLSVLAGEPLYEDSALLAAPNGSITRSSNGGYSLRQLDLDFTHGPVVVTTCCVEQYWPRHGNTAATVTLVQQTSLQVAAISTGDALYLLVTAGGEAKPHVSLDLYNAAWDNKVTKLSSVQTDGDGVAVVQNVSGSQRLMAVVREADGSPPVVFPDIAVSAVSTGQISPYRGSIILDRKLIRQGERLRISGYVRQLDGEVLRLPQEASMELVISPNFDPSKPDPIVVPATINKLFGSFHVSLRLPSAPRYGPYTIGVRPVAAVAASEVVQLGDPQPQPLLTTTRSVGAANVGVGVDSGASMKVQGGVTGVPGGIPGGPWQQAQFAFESFTVADPRPPTVELKLSAPKWARVKDTITITADAISYLGNAITAASIDVTWELPTGPKGLLTLTTDSKGTATGTLDLAKDVPDAAEKVKEGDVVSLSAVWVGPTRERLTATAEVQLSSGRYRIDIATSMPVNLPGMQFGATAKVVSLEDGNDITDEAVNLTLAPADDNNGTCSAQLPNPCTVTAGSQDFGACRLQLPCMGHYILSACTKDGSCGKLPMGQNTTEWANSPWCSWPSDLQLFPEQPRYAPGSSVRLSFEHPWPSSTALLVWGDQHSRHARTARLSGSGLKEVRVQMGTECANGCAVTMVLQVPRDSSSYTQSPYPDIPTSRLFDPAAPHTVAYHATILVLESQPLQVEVDAPEELAPGAAADITVHVKDGEKPAADAQVTILAVDRAVLDLLPYPLPQPADAFQGADMAGRFEASSLDSTLVRRSAVDAVFAQLMQRLGQDPWLPLATGVHPQYGLQPIDTPDDQYLATYASALTQLPYSGGGPLLGGGGPLMMLAKGGGIMAAAIASEDMMVTNSLGATNARVGTSSQAADAATASPRLTSSFASTPLFFVTRTTLDGTGTAKFTAPANLGKFAVRAFAATKGNKFGSGETELVVARRLSLTVAAPRFVRAGDRFDAGVVVSITGALADPVAVTVHANVLSGGVSMVGESNSAATTLTRDDSQNEVRFSFRASELGTVRISFEASDGAAATDAVVVDLEVAGQAEEVTVATSFAVRAEGSGAQWTEGLQLPDAVPGSGALNVTAAVGLFAAEVALFSEMQQNYVRPYCSPCIWPSCPRSCQPPGPNGYWAVSTALFSAVLSQYAQQAPPGTPSAVADAVKALGDLTNTDFGLLYVSPSKYGWQQPSSCDVWLNTWAIWLAQSYPASATPLVSTYVETWKAAVGRQLVKDAQQARAARPPSRYSDLETLSWAHLALGAGFAPPINDQSIQDDLSLGRLMQQFGNLSMTSQTLLALSLKAPTAAGLRSMYGARVAETATQTVSRLRVQGRTAYVAADEGAASAASPEQQALSLLLLATNGDAPELVQKLAAYVAGARPGIGTLSAPLGERATGVVLRALAQYDESVGNLQPDVTVGAAVGQLQLLNARFDDAADEPAHGGAAWGQVPPGQDLRVTASGHGEASVGVVMTFVPAQLLPYPLYRGLWVQRVVQLASPLDGSPMGPALGTVQLSSIVAITVQVTTPDDLQEVTARVLMPAGLEPVDPNIAQDAAASPSCSIDSADGGGSGGGGWWWWRWWPVCPAQQTRPQAVTLSWQRMQAGTHSFRFLAVAASVGTFIDPSTSAFASQQPELMGLTQGGTFTVCDGPGCTVVPAEGGASAAKACLSDCSGNGACDISSGRCHCQAGWSGMDCATAQQ